MRCCAISSRITDVLNVPIPPPPYCSGAARAQRPAALVFSDRRLKSSSGMPGASGSSRCSSGMISSRMKRRTCSRMSRSSSGSVKPGKVVMASHLHADRAGEVEQLARRLQHGLVHHVSFICDGGDPLALRVLHRLDQPLVEGDLPSDGVNTALTIGTCEGCMTVWPR